MASKKNKLVAILGKLFLFSLVLLVLLLGALDFLWLDNYLKDRIEGAVKHACPHCNLTLGSVTTHLFSGSVQLDKVVFEDSPKDLTTLDFHLERLVIYVDLVTIRSPMIEIPRIEVEQIELTATDDATKAKGMGPAFPKGDDDQLAHLPALRIDQINLHNSAFTYAARSPDQRRAHLSVYKIEGFLGPIVTRAEGRADIKAHIDALFEKSGRVGLDLLVQPFLADHHDLVNIKVDHQNLAELNPMFEVEDGIHLTGLIDHVETSLVIHQSTLTGQLSMRYHDVKLDVQPTPERKAVVATIAQVVQKIVLIPGRPRDPNDVPEARIDLKRAPHQSIFQFILAGVKPALASIVTGANKK